MFSCSSAIGGIPAGGIVRLAWVSSTDWNIDRNMKHDCLCVTSGRPQGGYCSFMVGNWECWGLPSSLSFSFCLTTCIFSSSYWDWLALSFYSCCTSPTSSSASVILPRSLVVMWGLMFLKISLSTAASRIAGLPLKWGSIYSQDHWCFLHLALFRPVHSDKGGMV